LSHHSEVLTEYNDLISTPSLNPPSWEPNPEVVRRMRENIPLDWTAFGYGPV
jgi:hypothetical protein